MSSILPEWEEDGHGHGNHHNYDGNGHQSNHNNNNSNNDLFSRYKSNSDILYNHQKESPFSQLKADEMTHQQPPISSSSSSTTTSPSLKPTNGKSHSHNFTSPSNGTWNPLRNDQTLLSDIHTTDSFAYRELMLNISDSNKILSKFMERLDDYIVNQGDMDENRMETIIQSVFQNKSETKLALHLTTLLRKLPKEATVLYESYNHLEYNFHKMLKDFIQCFHTRKELYSSLLKKNRDHCNMAIRQAVQAERLEAGTVLSQLKEKYETYHTEHTKELQNNLTEALKTKEMIEKQLKEEKESHKKFLHLKENLIAERDNAVKIAIKEQHEEYVIEKTRQTEQHAAEIQRMKDEFGKQVDFIGRNYEAQLEGQRRHLDEIKSLLTAERARVEGDSIKLRDQILDLQNQVTLERERGIMKLKDEMRKHDRELQQLQSENLKEQTKLKADLQEIVQRMKNDEVKKNTEIDNVLTRDRQTYEMSYNLKLERYEEQMRNDIKRLQAEWEVKKEDEINRLKNIHEQEIRKLLRENDRLQKLVSKGLNISDIKALKAHYSGNNSDNTSELNLNLSDHTSKEQPPVSNITKSSYTNRINMRSSEQVPLISRWSKLKDSIELQESYLNRSTSANRANRSGSSNNMTSDRVDIPPNALELDEAYESAKYSSKSNISRNVSNSAHKVRDYMSQLSDYLENDSPSRFTIQSRKKKETGTGARNDDITTTTKPLIYSEDSSESNENPHDSSDTSSM